MKQAKKLLPLAALICLLCTSCATTAVSNAQRYLDSSGAILDTLFASTTAAAPSSSGGETVAAEPLGTPRRLCDE